VNRLSNWEEFTFAGVRWSHATRAQIVVVTGKYSWKTSHSCEHRIAWNWTDGRAGRRVLGSITHTCVVRGVVVCGWIARMWRLEQREEQNKWQATGAPHGELRLITSMIIAAG
jgi:hypothetical protein